MFDALVVLMLMSTGDVSARPPAPHPACLDARTVTQMRQTTPTSLLVSAGTDRYQLTLAEACPAEAPGAALLAPAGWVCGNAREFVRTIDRLCAITAIETLSSRDYSRLARAADGSSGASMMAAVETHGERAKARNGFRGSYDYCFRPSTVRSWSADGEGILVSTSKKRSGGFGSYRVEFDSTCPQVAYLGVLSWRSGVGLDLICGNPGDAAMLTSANTWKVWDPEAQIEYTDVIGWSRGPHGEQRTVEAHGCMVAAVYPIDM
jgi:hypothetical protein